MSTDQPTLFEFERQTRTREERWLAAHVGGTTTNSCECGAHVTDDFRRVHGINGRVHACPQCSSSVEILNGAASNPDYSRRVDHTPADGGDSR